MPDQTCRYFAGHASARLFFQLAGALQVPLKDLTGWKSRVMVDRYAKFSTENLTVAAARIERSPGDNVIAFPTFSLRSKKATA